MRSEENRISVNLIQLYGIKGLLMIIDPRFKRYVIKTWLRKKKAAKNTKVKCKNNIKILSGS